jgi:hypothetical protein
VPPRGIGARAEAVLEKDGGALERVGLGFAADLDMPGRFERLEPCSTATIGVAMKLVRPLTLPRDSTSM